MQSKRSVSWCPQTTGPQYDWALNLC